MRGAKASRVTIAVFIVSSSLLVSAANCSFDKDGAKAPVSKHREGGYHSRPGEKFVANSFCDVCHLDFDQEELALNHELAGIGCERCHGESARHRSDEANITPPEIMYPKAKINPACMMCHPRHEIKDVKDHEPLLAGAETVFDQRAKDSALAARHQARYCTDCHGKEHRMKVRTVQWNKATGEFISQ